MICGEEWGQRHASPGGTLQKIQTLVPQDFPDPETETVRFTASREVLIRFYQGVLHNICGGVRIQSHPTGTPEQESLVPADQHFKSVPLAVQDLSHQHSIGGFDAGMASAAIVNVNTSDAPAFDSDFITVSLRAEGPTSGCSYRRSRHQRRALLDRQSTLRRQRRRRNRGLQAPTEPQPTILRGS